MIDMFVLYTRYTTDFYKPIKPSRRIFVFYIVVSDSVWGSNGKIKLLLMECASESRREVPRESRILIYPHLSVLYVYRYSRGKSAIVNFVNRNIYLCCTLRAYVLS